MSDPLYVGIGSAEDRLIEEVGELFQALGKARRFGWFGHHPEHPERHNIEDVRRELSDVYEACERLETELRQIQHNWFQTAEKTLQNRCRIGSIV